jgi:type II restriction/modification system DNA methylase subunit YeeA
VQGYMDFVGRDLFTAPLLRTLHEFEESNNFGSLIRPTVTDVAGMVEVLRSKNVEGSLFFYRTHEKVLRVLRQADFLSSKYHVVIANPPYMGGKGMNNQLKAFLQDNYKDYKADLFAAFTVRCLDLCKNQGFTGFMTPFVWMFLSSYENLRSYILNNFTLTSLVKPSYTAFFDSAIVAVCAYIIHKKHDNNYKGTFFDLDYLGTAEEQSPRFLQRKKDKQYYLASAADFKKIPSSVIAYLATDALRNLFTHGLLAEFADTRLGMATADNNLFLRLWTEVSMSRVEQNANSRDVAKASGKKWFPYQKGGDYRKWYGNLDYYVNWENDGFAIQNFKDSKTNKVRSHNYNLDFIFKKGVTWNALSSGKTSARLSINSLFDNAGSSLFVKTGATENSIMGLINSNIMLAVFPFISPTLNYQPGDLAKLPAFFPETLVAELDLIVQRLIDRCHQDWDSYETSWNFTIIPLLKSDYSETTLEATYYQLRTHWQRIVDEVQWLEKENNRILIEAYGLENDLSSEVPLNEITLTCNPHYRYDSNKSEAELETLLLADTMREFISYAVGCMFGRYSLDKEGLILANQGETIEDYLQKIPNPSFMPDRDNVIPIIEGDWFTDDISEQFRKFLRLTFGEENYQTNLTFIEKALDKPIQKYFLKDFYNDHVKRYKKRPIYWLFSSPKGNFNALIYLHRYRPDTASIVLNDYLREYRAKLSAHKTHLEAVSIDKNATQSEKTKALKTIENLRKIIDELEKYERDILYPLASQQLAIDLDDGVKVNYVKFGAALKKIAGLDAAED